ncbi:hypothetical protein BASA83_001072 [Batrachochytrium salamandrivorans]|nr:hypothetical protein BASA81_012208 [Batrachochytrium salamandrivorans]KAH9276381.1 hypothetical protein BASA83_001072 [Batrachochytrium salamandrivorans]
MTTTAKAVATIATTSASFSSSAATLAKLLLSPTRHTQTRAIQRARHLKTRSNLASSSILVAGVTAVTVVLTVLLIPTTAAQNLGRPCSPTVDHFTCEGTNFLVCDSIAATWQSQNICASGPCTADPTFGSHCYDNSLPGGSNARTSSRTSSSATSRPPASQSAPTSSSTSSTGSGNNQPGGTSSSSFTSSSPGGLSNAVVIGISVGVSLLVLLLVMCIAIYVLSQRLSHGKEKDNANVNMSSGRRNYAGNALLVDRAAGAAISDTSAPDVGTILEKKFVVTTDYEPSASDELRLRVGDSIVLDLLFNDGWAKGKNETTRQEGILPVACITQVN